MNIPVKMKIKKFHQNPQLSQMDRTATGYLIIFDKASITP
jgi:hypothetical protein